MGFSSLVAYSILFLLIFLAFSTLYFSHFKFTNTRSEALRNMAEILDSEKKSTIIIYRSNYSSSQLKLWLKNIGSYTLDPNKLLILLDGEAITYSWQILNDTINPGLWDPTEILFIPINKALVGKHNITVNNEYGFTLTKEINTSNDIYPPIIEKIDSRNGSVGDYIEIKVYEKNREVGLLGNVSIKRLSDNKIVVNASLADEYDGTYIYPWDTSSYQAGNYRIYVWLIDMNGNVAYDNSTVISLAA